MIGRVKLSSRPFILSFEWTVEKLNDPFDEKLNILMLTTSNKKNAFLSLSTKNNIFELKVRGMQTKMACKDIPGCMLKFLGCIDDNEFGSLPMYYDHEIQLGKNQITITRTVQDDGENEIRLEINGVEIGRGEINFSKIENYNNMKVYVSSPEQKNANGKISKFLLENI